jgi:hypothetical protein
MRFKELMEQLVAYNKVAGLVDGSKFGLYLPPGAIEALLVRGHSSFGVEVAPGGRGCETWMVLGVTDGEVEEESQVTEDMLQRSFHDARIVAEEECTRARGKLALLGEYLSSKAGLP